VKGMNHWVIGQWRFEPELGFDVWLRCFRSDIKEEWLQ
jgi:hypothetical protein